MNDKGDRSDSDAFEIIESYDWNEKYPDLPKPANATNKHLTGGSTQLVSTRSDNHAGFGLGIGCTFSSLFSVLGEPHHASVKKSSPIWLLGTLYSNDDFPSASWKKKKLSKKRHKSADPFRHDFYSRLWFTYRRNFPKLGSRFTSDCGWGCMLRTGQMMLAQALVVYHLGKEWRWNPFNDITGLDAVQRKIIAAFGDLEECPFSLHKLVELGAKIGKMPGDWFGPSSVAFSLRTALQEHRNASDLLRNVRIYAATDTTVVSSEVERLFETPNGYENFVVVLVPVRLGVEKLNEIYIPCLQQLLAMDCTLGIIGGRPKHSLYFIGWQDQYLIYLDPHRCQPTVDVSSPVFPLDSFHTNIPRRMPLRRLDPSMCLGFCFRSIHEFREFTSLSAKVVSPEEHSNFPIFTISEEPHPPSTALLESISDSSHSDVSLSNFELL